MELNRCLTKNLIEIFSHLFKNKIKRVEKKRKEIEMKLRKEISKVVVKRYKKSSKKEKGRILDEFTKITGYNRSYGGLLLNNSG